MDTLTHYIESIRTSALSDFYREHWGASREFSTLPFLTRGTLRATPLSSRRYTDESGLAKVVSMTDGRFLSEWAFKDIAAEEWGVASARPMVYLSNPYEALEKALWCRSHGMVPLIGERIPEVAQVSAAAYQVDSLIADERTITQMLPFLSSLSEPLAAITVIGEQFDRSRLFSYARFTRRLRLVLALPETGVIASAGLESGAFSLAPGVIAESIDGELVVTKDAMLVTPIVRLRTDIRAAVDGSHVTLE